MTEKVTVRFSVNKLKDVPVIGSRKSLLVNGKRETLYVKSIDVDADKTYSDDMKAVTQFNGVAVYTKDLWLWPMPNKPSEPMTYGELYSLLANAHEDTDDKVLKAYAYTYNRLQAAEKVVEAARPNWMNDPTLADALAQYDKQKENK